MELTLSWDLLVIVFFAVIVAYSFIVGKDESVKIIIATYIAVVAVQGFGNVLTKLSGPDTTFWSMLGLSFDMNVVAITKVVVLTAVIVFLAIRGGFTTTYDRVLDGIWDSLLTAVFGFATAGLLLSTLLTYIADRPLLDQTLATAPPLVPLLKDGQLVRIMVDYQDLWFSLPAFLLLAVGFYQSLEKES
jgi:multisubunit Na+/H+ antiporter MnhC subunit